MGRPGEYSVALRGRCADLHSRRAQGTQGYYLTEALATVSKMFSTEGDRLGTSEVGCVVTGGRRHSAAEAHSTPSRKGLAARRVRTLQTFPFTVPRACISSGCNTALPRNQTCTNEPCRQSDLCPHRDKTNQRPRKSSPMSCVDFFCWKTRHSQDQNKSLSSVLRVRASRMPTR